MVNFEESRLFSSEIFELVGLIENPENDSEIFIPDIVQRKFTRFISYLSSLLNLKVSFSYSFDVAIYYLKLTLSSFNKHDLKRSNNPAHVRIALKPGGIEISFIVNDKTDDKEHFINNCTKLLYPESYSDVKESLLNFDWSERSGFQVNLSNASVSLKEWLESPWLIKFRELLYRISKKCVFENQNIRVISIIEKTKVLQLSNSRLIEKVNRILIVFFPLLILASYDEPIPIIESYLHYYQDSSSFYSLNQCSNITGVNQKDLEKWVKAIDRKRQAILQGPPGTGKTFIAKQLAQYFTQGRDGFSELVQFHPSYSYEDFMQGIRPQTENGQLTYSLVRGRFLEFCKKAESYEDTCVLIIDEINRANLSNVFGELMYLLEYRDQEITLAGSNEPFRIPDNVRIIGTMNTADRSIALVDHALRRRFAFIKIFPNYEVLKNYHEQTVYGFPIENLIPVLQQLNETIDDPHYQIGISFFMISDLQDHIEEIWTMEIEPYLEEYFYDQPEKVDEFRWNKVQDRILQS